MSKLKEVNEAASEPVDSFNVVLSRKERSQQILEEFEKQETRLVKGIFRCIETPDSVQRIQIKKYKNVPMFDKWMRDGHEYEIPLYVARHLNGIDVTAAAIGGKVGSCSYPVHGFKYGSNEEMPKSEMDAFGNLVPVLTTQKRVRRYAFESTEFLS